jgi:hypothetical protein
VTGGDVLDEAVAELYSADPEAFMPRRQELAARARAAGQASVAKQITALRKPTRSAWLINQLARSDPDATSRLTGLGDELRAAERSADGSRLRELSQARRQLLASLVKRVLEVSGQPTLTAAIREEITATFAAALADREVAEQLQQGTLVRAQWRSGFGGANAPALTVVPPLPDSHRATKAKAKAKSRPGATPTPPEAATPSTGSPETGPSETGPSETGPPETPAAEAGVPTAKAAKAKARETAAAEAKAAEAKAAQQERRAKVRSKAEEALAKAAQAVAAAAQDQREQEQMIRRLERELGQARIRLRAAAAEARRTEAARRSAQQALDRLPD